MTSTGFEPVTSGNTGAMHYQLTHIGSQVIFVGSIFPVKEMDGRRNEINVERGNTIFVMNHLSHQSVIKILYNS